MTELGEVVRLVTVATTLDKLEEAANFYTDLLGFEIVEDVTWPKLRREVVLQAPSGQQFQLAIWCNFKSETPEFYPNDNRASVEISHPDPRGLTSALTSRGVEADYYESPKVDWVVFLDPLGNFLVCRCRTQGWRGRFIPGPQAVSSKR